jgi:hypothetical protein
LKQVRGNNLWKKFAVLGASFGPELAGGQYWRKTSRDPRVNKKLMEVNLKQMLLPIFETIKV